ncbi:acid protease [Coprinopsis marcescibilis]|uniref:Acid protease n=1 Tax=Coprinopsis marcescibilis TaxID=230819 RepID=A0A5C3L3B8_COPMA|nr:acid protease [Coprinopsis marcescibilis]
MSVRFLEGLRCLFCILQVYLVWEVRSSPLPGSSVSIPISGFSLGSAQEDVHAAVLHQQHMNRGTRRLATMTGQRQPEDHELFSRLFDRIHSYKHAAPLSLISGAEVDVNGTSGVLEERPPNLTPADAVDYAHTIGLNIEANDVGYIGVVKIGTPPRSFNLLMDSGSADMWVGSESCRGDDGGDCGKHNFLGPSASSTFKSLKDDDGWSIVYGSGAVSGHLVTDIVSIGDLTLKNFKFGVASNESADFIPNDIPFDGLLGLAKSKISRQHCQTLVEALHQKKLIPEAIVSYKIPRLLDGHNDGEMMLGAMNPVKYQVETVVTLKNTNTFGFWEIPLDDIRVGNHSMNWSGRTAVLDTGTTLLLAPEEDVIALHKLIPGAKQDSSGSWTLPCTFNTSLAFQIGGKLFTIDSRDITFLPADPANPEGDCISGIGIGYVGPFNSATQWLVGDVFLKNVYFSTNEGRDEISIAKLRS